MPDIGISLPPASWRPRPYQEKLWKYLECGGKRAVGVWHRRAGKDEVCLHHAATSAWQRPAGYWHCLPEYAQGRKAIWTAMNAHTGKRRIDEAFPHAMRETTIDNEMFIRFKNGSTWQVIGSDRYDATVGSGVAGIVYSEFALAHPSAWAYHRPILEENNGWATFISTPRGHNHLKSMYEFARTAPGWFAELLTVNDTGAMSTEEQARALAEYQMLYGEDVGTAQYRQEYLCDFAAAILGAFYALEMAAVRREDRIVAIEHEPSLPVHTVWDLGVDDDTAIWFFQVVGAQVFLHDVYGASNVGVEHYVEVLKAREEQYGWKTGSCYVPHDAKVREWGTGRTRVETMRLLGLKPELVRAATVEDGINAARRMLPLCVFHPRTEELGVNALEQHRREWDEEKKAFSHKPLHDWTSDVCDAFRYLGLCWKLVPRIVAEPKRRVEGWIIPPPPEPRLGGLRI